jgi:hypothetical protein
MHVRRAQRIMANPMYLRAALRTLVSRRFSILKADPLVKRAKNGVGSIV